MGFANPWLLIGLAALAAPILAHLVRREERGGRGFPSLMFVRRIPYELKSRRTLRDLVLLALRCLALVAIVLAFARPFIGGGTEPALEERRDTVWLLDRSYSMSAPGRWERATAEIQDRIAALPSGARAALVAFDDSPRVLAGLTADRTRLRTALAQVEPGDGRTELGAAFGTANRLLSRSGPGRHAVVVISDLQRSALDAAGALPLSEGVDLETVAVTGPVGANVALLDASLLSGPQAAVEHVLAVRARNTGDAPVNGARIVLEVDGRAGGDRSLSLAPGETDTISFPVVLGTERPTRVVVETSPDALAADNRYHAVLAPRRPLIAALVEPDRPRPHQGVFLEEALRLAREPVVAVRRVDVTAVDESLLARVDVLILDDVALASAAAARAAEAFVNRGGGILVASGPAAAGNDAGFPGRLFGETVHHAGNGAGLAPPGAAHPLWAAADPRGSLSGARIATSRRLAADPEDRVVARLDDGTPLLLERRLGGGRILALATTADPRWGTLALEPGFVPLAQASVAHLAGGKGWRSAYDAGDTVDLTRHAAGLPGAADWRAYLDGGGAVVVESPAGRAERLREREAPLVRADAPGIYEAHRADGRGAALPFAVNTGRAESLLAAATAADLERSIVRRSGAVSGPPVAREYPAGPAGHAPAWWWLMVLAGVVLAIESGLANWISRRRAAGAAA